MAKFLGENPSFPEHLRKREDFEGLQYQGDDTGFEVLPHLNLSWHRIHKIWEETGKPIADLGASFSTLPVEGQLRGIDIQPVDIMHMVGRENYEIFLANRMAGAKISDRYSKILHSPKEQQFMELKQPIENYYQAVDSAIKKVKANFIVADIAKIPVADRHFSIVIAHDSVPKHSPTPQSFFDSQLPEILRVTDVEARISPMALYKKQYYKQKYNEDYDEMDWVKEENPTAENLRYGRYHEELEEAEPLYNNEQYIKKLGAIADNLGFDFKLERGMSNAFEGFQNFQEPETGIFTRKNI